ncbi:MAG: hypothetical protein U1D55_05790 [Phycisphaerae bacterium]
MVWGLLKKAEKPRVVAKAPPRVQEAMGPPITAEELTANLSALEKKLNHEMKCPAGKNQVFLRSLLTGNGTTKPRIALKCHLRRDIKLTAEVFYEHIRDVCCKDPTQCPAHQAFKGRFVPT